MNSSKSYTPSRGGRKESAVDRHFYHYPPIPMPAPPSTQQQQQRKESHHSSTSSGWGTSGKAATRQEKPPSVKEKRPPPRQYDISWTNHAQQQRPFGQSQQQHYHPPHIRRQFRKELPPPPPAGRGVYVNQKGEEDGFGRGRQFRKARRPLVPDKEDGLDGWIPRVMSVEQIEEMEHRDMVKQCIQVTDAFIKLDTHLDESKHFNSSNLHQLRSEQQKRLQNMSAKPDEYVELIAQCEANPGKFLGTQYCLRLVLGTQPLEEFIRQRAWGKEQLKEWDITTDWQAYERKLVTDEASPSQTTTGGNTSADAVVVVNNADNGNDVNNGNGDEPSNSTEGIPPNLKTGYGFKDWLNANRDGVQQEENGTGDKPTNSEHNPCSIG